MEHRGINANPCVIFFKEETFILLDKAYLMLLDPSALSLNGLTSCSTVLTAIHYLVDFVGLQLGNSYEDRLRKLKTKHRSTFQRDAKAFLLGAWLIIIWDEVLLACSTPLLDTGWASCQTKYWILFRRLTSLVRQGILLIRKLPFAFFHQMSVENALSRGFSQQSKASHSWQHNYPAM